MNFFGASLPIPNPRSKGIKEVNIIRRLRPNIKNNKQTCFPDLFITICCFCHVQVIWNKILFRLRPWNQTRTFFRPFYEQMFHLFQKYLSIPLIRKSVTPSEIHILCQEKMDILMSTCSSNTGLANYNTTKKGAWPEMVDAGVLCCWPKQTCLFQIFVAVVAIFDIDYPTTGFGGCSTSKTHVSLCRCVCVCFRTP